MLNISYGNYMNYPDYRTTTTANYLNDHYHTEISDIDEHNNNNNNNNNNIGNLEIQTIEDEFGPKHDALEIIIPVTIIYCIIFLTGIIGNISTCIVIKKHPSMHTATNYYLFSLAISDFILLVTGVPQEVYFIWSKYPYIFGEIFCIGRGLIAETSANATVLTITAFTVERYIAICHPWLLCKAMSKLNRAIRIIILIWILSIVCAIPLAIQFGIRTFHGIEKCVVVRQIVQHSFQISTIIFFFTPMSIIMILYLLIGSYLYRSHALISRKDEIILKGNSLLKHKSARNSEQVIFRRTSSNFAKNQFGTRRVLKMLVAVVICFFLCWAPFHAQRLVAVYGSNMTTSRSRNNHSTNYDDNLLMEDNLNEAFYHLDEERRDHHETIYTILTYISGILYYISTCINPVLYNLMSNKYRQAFKAVLCRQKSKQYFQWRLHSKQQQSVDCKKTLKSSSLRQDKKSISIELPTRISLLQSAINERQ